MRKGKEEMPTKMIVLDRAGEEQLPESEQCVSGSRDDGASSSLSEADRRRLLVDFNDTTVAYPLDARISDLFEAQVARSADSIAVEYAGQTLTYGELNRQANRLAHHLRSMGVKPDTRVAICAERGVQMVVGLLGILKAGGAYVPLDPEYPPERLSYMLNDSAPVVLLTHLSASVRTALSAVLTTHKIPVLDLQANAHEWADEAESNPHPDCVGLTAKHLAYVIYTSGSTGMPKGVAIEHRNAVSFIWWSRSAFISDITSRTFFSTSLNFDLSIFELFVPITTGGCVRIVNNALDIAEDSSGGVLINTVPSAINGLIDIAGIPQTIRTVNLAGEPLKRQLVEQIFASTNVETVCNLYGPTETTTYSTWVRMNRKEGFVAHIGRPISNTRIYILDAHGQPVPLGVAGELYIGGAGVARGYLNRPELTAERFIADPFSADPHARMYKTGDVGRYLADGNIEYLGRNDHQVKIRGFRIELGEIEARLAEHASIREAVVLAREDRPGDKRLVAYVTAESSAALDIEALRTHLSATLPEYMVPAAYVLLEQFPLTPNGKLDRKALPAPDSEAYATRAYEAPVGEVESVLARIWSDVLKLERVGRHDNFFALGGHSLLAVTLIERMRRADLQVDVRALFATPTLKALADSTEEIKELVL
jgi:amino acid adenylation domain-containing protein